MTCIDHNGILLAGITATEDTIANLSVTLLLTQLTLAALSWAGTPNVEDAEGFNPYRPDWTMITDEFHIIAVEWSHDPAAHATPNS